MTDTSKVIKVKYRGKETSTGLLEANNMSIRSAPDGSLVVELFRYGPTGAALEGIQLHFCPQDRALLRARA